jgi:hypothetical protein
MQATPTTNENESHAARWIAVALLEEHMPKRLGLPSKGRPFRRQLTPRKFSRAGRRLEKIVAVVLNVSPDRVGSIDDHARALGIVPMAVFAVADHRENPCHVPAIRRLADVTERLQALRGSNPEGEFNSCDGDRNSYVRWVASIALTLVLDGNLELIDLNMGPLVDETMELLGAEGLGPLLDAVTGGVHYPGALGTWLTRDRIDPTTEAH